jgi:DNA-binding XRE family transcriptional regulator
MPSDDARFGYWARLTKSIRDSHNLSQEQLAEQLGIDQGTVSRWERGLTAPHYDIRKLLDAMARDSGLATLGDLAEMVTASPFPMVLVDHDQVVFAASASSGFVADTSIVEQTPVEERAFLQAFIDRLVAAGFWDGRTSRVDYEFTAGDDVRRAVVVAIAVRGQIFALVQKAW